MTAYGNGRYRVIERPRPDVVLCQDQNLDRRVCIHWVPPGFKREAVRARLAALQSVRSPYVALIYDLVEESGRVGVVEENLDAPVEATGSNRLRCLYELCAGLAALHDHDLAHGALDEDAFRVGPLGRGRVCNLAFGGAGLDEPSTDREAFAARLVAMGAERVADPDFLRLCAALDAMAEPAPNAGALRDRLAALLLRDQHRALVFWRGTSVELNAGTPTARLKHPSPDVASVTLKYDGTRFFLAAVTGEVSVNNVTLAPGKELPDSCVIALGGHHRPWSERYFITFDQSHPDVA